MRLVLDTNMLISAFIAHGQCSELLEHCVRRHVLVSSQFILKEFEDKLLGKLKFATADVQSARALLERRLEIVSPTALTETVCRDPDDDWVLATAGEGNCDCIVTGDQDLLDLHPHGQARILRPAAFWRYELMSDT